MSELVIPDLDLEVGLGAEDSQKVSTNKLDWYKGDKDRKDAVAIVNFATKELSYLKKALKEKPDLTEAQKKQVLMLCRKKVAEELGKPVDALDPIDMMDLEEVRFRPISGSFKEGVGYVAWPKTMTADEQKLYVESKVGAKKDYVTTIILVYPVDAEGDIDMEKLTKKKDGRLVESFKVLPWRMSTDKYHDLVRINKKIGKTGKSLANTDLLIECTDKNFQKMKIDDAGPSAWKTDPVVQRAVLARALKFQDKLEPFKHWTVDELKEKLGVPTAGGASSSSDVDPDFMASLAEV